MSRTKLVKGENVIVAEYNEDLESWVLYGCARTCTLKMSSEIIETSVRGQGIHRTILPSKITTTISIEGLVKLEQENLLSLGDLRERQLEQTKVLIRYERTARDGVTKYSEEVYAYVVDTEDTGPYDNMNSFTVEFACTGSPTRDFNPVEILANVIRYEYEAVGGEAEIEDTDLIGKTILSVVKDGVGRSEIIIGGSTAPVGQQCRYTTASGRINFPIGQEFFAGEKAYVLYR
jgi:hypothetical protein